MEQQDKYEQQLTESNHEHQEHIEVKLIFHLPSKSYLFILESKRNSQH